MLKKSLGLLLVFRIENGKIAEHWDAATKK